MTLPLHQAKLDSRLVLIDGAPTKPATPRRPKPKLPDPTHGAPQAKSMARSRSTQASLPLCRPSRRRGPDGPVRRAVFTRVPSEPGPGLMAVGCERGACTAGAAYGST